MFPDFFFYRFTTCINHPENGSFAGILSNITREQSVRFYVKNILSEGFPYENFESDEIDYEIFSCVKTKILQIDLLQSSHILCHAKRSNKNHRILINAAFSLKHLFH